MAISVRGGNSSKVLPLKPIAILFRSNSSKVLPMQPIATHSYMAISVRGQLLIIPPIADHWIPLLYGNFSWGGFLKSPPIAAHCSPLLHENFSQEGNSSKVLPLQPFASHSYKAISVRGLIPENPPIAAHCSPLHGNFSQGGNSWKVLPLQLIEAHSYMAILVRGVGGGVIPQKFSHCSPLQPTLKWQF